MKVFVHLYFKNYQPINESFDNRSTSSSQDVPNENNLDRFKSAERNKSNVQIYTNRSQQEQTHCLLKVVPVALGVISSAEEDSSDSLSDPVAKKRDITHGF